MLRRSAFTHPTELPARECTAPGCGRYFIPLRPMQQVCSPGCAGRKVRAARKAEKAQDAAKRKALKTIPQLKKEAQHAFNAFIRERDRQAGHVCISAGVPLDWSGNGVDAGHYRSVGAAPHLRFNENNCHAQSKRENQWRAGNAVDYRIGLIQRIGLEAVEALEADNRVHKWTREELIGIRDTYRAKLKALVSQQKETA